MTNPNILTIEEIREILHSFYPHTEEKYVGEIQDYFKYYSHELDHLKDKKFRRSFIIHIYLHKHALDSYIKLDKETKGLKIEKAELIEKNKQLEAIQKELEKNLEFEKESGLCHLEAIGVCEDWCFTNQVEPLNEKLANKSKEAEDNWKSLQDSNRKVEKYEKQIKQLEKDLEDREDFSEQFKQLSDKSERQEIQIKKLENEVYLNSKPLPKLPSKFKLFKERAKTKLQQLVEKVKVREQKTTARVEVSVK